MRSTRNKLEELRDAYNDIDSSIIDTMIQKNKSLDEVVDEYLTDLYDDFPPSTYGEKQSALTDQYGEVL